MASRFRRLMRTTYNLCFFRLRSRAFVRGRAANVTSIDGLEVAFANMFFHRLPNRPPELPSLPI